MLTEKEINGCLQRAFDSLPEQDQENVKAALGPLMAVPGIGLLGAMRTLLVTDQAAALTYLDATLTKGGARKS
jgi:hypothetical protein